MRHHHATPDRDAMPDFTSTNVMTNDVMDVSMSRDLLMDAQIDSQPFYPYDYPLNFLPYRRSYHVATQSQPQSRFSAELDDESVEEEEVDSTEDFESDPRVATMEHFFERRFQDFQVQPLFRRDRWFATDDDVYSEERTETADSTEDDDYDLYSRQETPTLYRAVTEVFNVLRSLVAIFLILATWIQREPSYLHPSGGT